MFHLASVLHTCALLQVHFDCKFKGIDAVSSRYARTLGGNRTIAEVEGLGGVTCTPALQAASAPATAARKSSSAHTSSASSAQFL